MKYFFNTKWKYMIASVYILAITVTALFSQPINEQL